MTSLNSAKERLQRASNWYDVDEVLTMDGLDELAPLFQRMRDENVPHLAYDFEIVKKRAKPYLDDLARPYYNIWAAYRGDEPVGFAIGYMSPFDFGDDLGASTRYIFVEKKYRGSPVAFLLIRKFMEWSAIRGAVRWMIDTTSPREYEQKRFAKMAEKLGFKSVGAQFIKDMNHA